MVEVRVKEGGESLAWVNRDVANVFVISIELKPITKSVQYIRSLIIIIIVFLFVKSLFLFATNVCSSSLVRMMCRTVIAHARIHEQCGLKDGPSTSFVGVI